MPENYYFEGVEGAIVTAVESAVGRLAARGARVAALRVPDPQPLVDVTGLVSRAESAAIHARVLKERPQELQPVVRARLAVGLHIAAFDYLQALRLRARLTREFVDAVFAEVDVLMVPTIPEPAPSLDEVTGAPVAEVIARMARFSRLTRPFNGLGLPALSLPCGFSRDGCPWVFRSSDGPSTRPPCCEPAGPGSRSPASSRSVARRSTDESPSYRAGLLGAFQAVGSMRDSIGALMADGKLPSSLPIFVRTEVLMTDRALVAVRERAERGR